MPYANGPAHIGHAIGAYIPADVYSRYLRAKGEDVLFVCGSDEHGTPIAVAAEAEGVRPQELVDKYHEELKRDFDSLGIRFDHYGRTTLPIHYETSKDFFLKMLENGKIEKRTVTRPFCPHCKRFLPDRYVKGECPKCRAKDERGDQCEACGKQLEPHELVRPYCIICKNTPEQKSTEHWFFKLSELALELKEWIEGNKHWPPNARNFALGWIREGLEDRAITRDLEWGVPVPLKEAKGKVLYVWFDAPIGYISITKEWAKGTGKPEEWKKYWQDDCEIVHFIGKDNIPFHTIIWPGILLGEGNHKLPYQIASNEFLTLEGKKMSTSRGWIVWINEFVKKYPADTLRYTLVANSPEIHDADFSWHEYQKRVNTELSDTLGNFVQRTLAFATRHLDGKVPPEHERGVLEKELEKKIEETIDETGELIEKFKLQAALKKIMELAGEGNKYFSEREPWKALKTEHEKHIAETCIHESIRVIYALSIGIAPFLPDTAEKIWKLLGLEGSVHEQKWNDAKKTRLKSGHGLKEPQVLFKKIEDKEIREEIAKLEKLSREKGGKPMVKYEDFEKLEIKVGRIVEAEAVEKSEKLVKLRVDTGEVRQIIAGIKKNYSPEELTGRKVVVLCNLEPKKLMGLESQGMVLADENGRLLLPEKDAKEGSRVR